MPKYSISETPVGDYALFQRGDCEFYSSHDEAMMDVPLCAILGMDCTQDYLDAYENTALPIPTLFD